VDLFDQRPNDDLLALAKAAGVDDMILAVTCSDRIRLLVQEDVSPLATGVVENNISHTSYVFWQRTGAWRPEHDWSTELRLERGFT
jgi:hypothetical protein